MNAAAHRALTPMETTRIVEALRANGVRYALVFGSAARDALGAESDLDIAVTAARPLSGMQCFHLIEALAAACAAFALARPRMFQ